MKLYMVEASGPEDFSLDLFVWAIDPEHALTLWTHWLDTEVEEAYRDVEGEEPQVLEIPHEMPSEPRGLVWHTEVKTVTPE